jgi:ElaB/YqjD/DUF883 family membrane-anchored ribosome-binding protein
MTKIAEGAAVEFAADLAAVRQDIARLAETMSGLVQHQTRAAGHHVSDAIGDTRDKIATTAADVEKRVRAASSEIEASVERHPLTALLIVFGIGLSIGMLSRSRG